MLTVEVDAGRVEVRLVAGELACPDCGDRLGPWGWARARSLRGAGEVAWLRPRRARCAGCGETHVLLPVSGLLRRADGVEVIGAALAAKAAGLGHRRVAGLVGRPVSTVRGWLRRFAVLAERVRSHFTAVLVAVAVDPAPPEPAGSVFADAVTAIAGACAAVSSRWSVVSEAPVWRIAGAVSGGLLLAPSGPAKWINTSWLWAARP